MTAYDNSQVRESIIWDPFSCSGFYNELQRVERQVIFGLYSNNFRNSNSYLLELSGIELANALNDYNTKMAGLTNEEIKVVNDIVAKRFVTINIEQLVHDNKLVTQLQKINADADEWDAKIAALSTDRAALETLRAKVQGEIKKVTARIAELQAYIQVEVSQLALIDVDIAEKEHDLSEKNLQLVSKTMDEAKMDLQILQVANEVAKIQINIIEAGLELIDIDMKVSRSNLEIAQTENNIVKAGLAKSELDVAIARTAVEQADLETYGAKVIIAGLETDLANEELQGVLAAQYDESALNSAKLTIMDERQEGHLQSISNQAERSLFSIKEKDVSTALEDTVLDKTNSTQNVLDTNTNKIQDAHVFDAVTNRNGAIAAATIIATANIASTLTHTIKKG